MGKPESLARRSLLARALASAPLLPLAGCDQLSKSDWFVAILERAETVTRTVQRAITGKNALAAEFSEDDISKTFRANGTTDPENAAYQALAKAGFRNWRLEVGGLVERPAKLSLAELRALPSRSQITRHDCVEGWSCIGKWKGVPLATLLERVGPKPEARYVMFYCADPMEPESEGTDSRYYESIDLTGAYHPQTILAYEMNDAVLPVAYGAPLRLRDERQLGYKMAKYIMRIELVESFADIRGGKGGYWEDQGYEWYAGI
jgi:DMSO/TMAO reductase YedYZ molybdopterin-dependent catalytic subunit